MRDAPPSDDDDSVDGAGALPEIYVDLPGMPAAPRAIRLKDPYPNGQLRAVAQAAPPPPAAATGHLQHDGSTTIVFVKAGSEHRALMYLLMKVGGRVWVWVGVKWNGDGMSWVAGRRGEVGQRVEPGGGWGRRGGGGKGSQEANCGSGAFGWVGGK